jgi:nucleoid-associated protein YgaU
MKPALTFALALFFAALARGQTGAPVITPAPITTEEKSATSSADAADLADLRTQIKKLSAELALAWKENDRLKTYALGQVATANQKAEAAQAQAESATKALAQNQADLDAKNKQIDALNAQLADLQKSDDDLRKTTASVDPSALATAQRDLEAEKQKVADLEAVRTDLEQKLADAQAIPVAPSSPTAPTATSSAADVQKQAAETQDKLDMSLRAYTVLQNDNDQLKDSLAKAGDEKNSLAAQLDQAKRLAADRLASLNLQAQQMAGLQATAAADDNAVSSLRDQLRQMQNLVAQLADENSRLKTQMVLNAPSPSAPSPERYAPPPTPAAVASPAPAAAPAENGAQTYKVASGDTLAKISKKFYGTTTRWQEILAANHDKLHDDKSLRIGMELTIP